MVVATVLVTLLFAGMLGASAAATVTRRQPYVQAYFAVGVPEDRLDRLAATQLAGAAGVLVGLLWAPVGIAAGILMLGYFLLAILAHMRTDDVRNLPLPALFAVVATIALALRVATS